MRSTPTRSNKEGFIYQELQLGRRGNKSTRGEKRSNFSSFDNPIFEDHTTGFEGPKVIIEDTRFYENYNTLDNSSFESLNIEEPPKDQFVPITSTSGSPTVVQSLKTYQ